MFDLSHHARIQGWGEMKRYLLRKIVEQATKLNMRSHALQSAAQVLREPHADVQHPLLTNIFTEISTHTLVLIGQ